MRLEWLQYLCDPGDGSDLTFAEITLQEDDNVVSGKLRSASGQMYEIRQGIPIFVTGQMQSKDSVESFAYEWDEFGFDYAKQGWEHDVVGPLIGSTSFFQNKLVVDAGAGSGSQSCWMAEAGARLVISLELSDGIFRRHRETTAQYKDVIFPVQADIAFPPLRVVPDVLYCFNVIQHTADPAKTFAKLAALVGEETVFLFNIYTKRSEFKFKLVRAVRGAVRVLPFEVWKWLAFVITTVAYPISKLPVLRRLIRIVVPVSHSFKETWLDVYDAFGGHHYQENMTLLDQKRMIAAAGLQVIRQSPFGYALARQPANPGVARIG